jgi:hypothetical protein
LPKFSPLKSLFSVAGKVLDARHDVLARNEFAFLHPLRDVLDGHRVAVRVVEHHHALHAGTVDE